MQEQAEKKSSTRLSVFFKSSRGQTLAAYCAYSGLGCFIISLLLIDYTRLSWPFMLASLPLTWVGSVAHSRKRLAQVVLLLWGILFTPIGGSVFFLGDQARQQTRLQQQTIQMENQLNEFQKIEEILGIQLPLLQNLRNGTNDTDERKEVISNAILKTHIEQLVRKVDIRYLSREIDYDIFLLRDNFRNLPTSSLVNDNNEEIGFNTGMIQFYQGDLDKSLKIIDDNNLLLPAEDLQRMPEAEQKTCASGFPCIARYTWQQPFIDGWQSISSASFTVTWPFWFSLLLGIAGMFLLLPRILRRNWVVTYRVRYTGTLAHLNDPDFPDQKRRELSGEASIVKVEIRSSLFLLKQKDWSDETREFLHLHLGPGVTILDVFLKQTTTDNVVEANYDTSRGDIVIKVKPLAPVKFAPRTPYKVQLATLRAQRRFPIQLYVVVDYFAGPLTATTPITEVETLREQRGPGWLIIMAAIFHEIAWWIYAIGLYAALNLCSLMFFRGAPYTYPPLLMLIGLGGFITVLILQGAEVIILRTTTVQHKSKPGLA